MQGRRPPVREAGGGGALERALARFDVNPGAASREIVSMLASDPGRVILSSIAVLQGGQRSAGNRFLVKALVETGLLLNALCDRSLLSLEQAAGLIPVLSRVDPLVDVHLLHSLLEQIQHDEAGEKTAMVCGVLAVYDAAGLGGRLLPMLVQLLRKRDSQLRSKVALMVGRGSAQVGWAVTDADPRVRANAIESLWGVKTNPARALLWKATADPHQRVVGNALLGLHKIGDRGAEEPLRRMARHESPCFRATAAWVMGQSGDRRYLELLEQMASDPDEHVRRNALRSAELLKAAATDPEPPKPETAPSEAPQAAAPPPVQRREPEPPPSGSYREIHGLTL